MLEDWGAKAGDGRGTLPSHRMGQTARALSVGAGENVATPARVALPMVGTVLAGDWRDLLPGTYDPARAVVITDPPFGLGHAIERGYTDLAPWRHHVEELLELLPALRHVIRGPSPALLRHDYPEPRRLCIEVAGYRRRAGHRPGVVPHMWHGWAVYGRILLAHHVRPPTGDARAIQPYADNYRQPTISGRQHRGLTPYGSALWMVETWTDPGMVVLDPFAGVGTIGRAASALGFDYQGAELEEEWAIEATRAMGYSHPLLGLA